MKLNIAMTALAIVCIGWLYYKALPAFGVVSDALNKSISGSPSLKSGKHA
jgi:hypothetical protein